MEPACVETCPAEVFHFGDANEPTSAYSKFMAQHGSKTTVLKPEEKTKPSVAYLGHMKEMESKIPKGKVHDPYSYEIETWTQLAPIFPKAKRVQWAKVEQPMKVKSTTKSTTGTAASATANANDAKGGKA
jgi:tetrathionate reductase subunit B